MQVEFQALIGILQLSIFIKWILRRRMFQALIGILQQ